MTSVDASRVRDLAAREGLALTEPDIAEVAVRLEAILAELDSLPADLPAADTAFEPRE